MSRRSVDAVVVGGGSAGLAAAISLREAGRSVALIERDPFLGGILLQCIHSGFGIHEFGEDLTGPEYAERFIRKAGGAGIEVYLDTTVMEIAGPQECRQERPQECRQERPQECRQERPQECRQERPQECRQERPLEGERQVTAYSRSRGLLSFSCRAVILSMGCRERNRGNIAIAGTRPAGVFTAGLAQRLVNIEGCIPGRRVVIIGSGDIGLIMARRLTLVGCAVLGVIEIQPYPSGLVRNIVQCLNDFSIPLHLAHVVTRIEGRDRVEGVEVAPLEDGHPDYQRAFRLECDTVLLSVGLIPENELSRAAGVALNQETSGPWVDADLMTGVAGIFACGNVLHVHDLVDFVTEEARRCGQRAAAWLGGEGRPAMTALRAGANVRYVVPNACVPGRENVLFLRPLVVKNDAVLEVRVNGQPVKSRKYAHVQPSEMIRLTLEGGLIPAPGVEGPSGAQPSAVEVSLR